MSYSLTINGKDRGGFDSLDAVFRELDAVYHSGELDLFDDVSWELTGPKGTVSETMDMNMWEAQCENAHAFKLWLDAFRW